MLTSNSERIDLSYLLQNNGQILVMLKKCI